VTTGMTGTTMTVGTAAAAITKQDRAAGRLGPTA
jgi:hypothetical protein